MSTPTAQVSSWLADFGSAVSRGDFARATSMFGDESYWRDLVSFTWNLKTAEGPQQIRAMLEATMPAAKPSSFVIQGEGSEANGVTEGWFTFETASGRGRGHVRLIGGKAWTLLTTLQELKGFEEKKRDSRPKGVEHGVYKDRKSWLEARQDEERTLGFAEQPYVVVIGGGQAGIILGARLKKLGVPAIVVEKNPKPGDSWRNRYKSLVFATGMSAVPNLPDYPGMSAFKGKQVHSSQYKSGEEWRGKRALVVGSNNSAHDICADLWEHGAEVTMVQRSTTHVARSDSLMDLALGGLYSESAVKSGIDTATADLIFASLPYKALPPLQVPVYQQMKERDAEFYSRLEKAGFQLDFGDDESGLFMKYLRRGSGYYIDVGASELVANGSIKLKNGAIERVTESGLAMQDGSELHADLIVWATGYGSMNGWVAQLIDQATADKVGKCWGLGSGTRKDPGPWEGELRNMWKPTQVPNLWMQGGNLHQNRHYSLCLALQLKARLEKIPTPVYALAPVHHKS